MIRILPPRWRGGGETLPVGSIVPFINGDILPDGYLLCDGAEVVKSEYSALYGVIGDVFGEPSDSSHFVLPDLRDKTLWGGGNNSNVGDNIEAGLPNITGSLSTSNTRAWTYALGGQGVGTDAITASNTGAAAYADGTSTYAFINGFSFDASKSNPIYSDDVNTVQPPALAVSFIIKAFGPSGSGVIDTDPTKISVSYRDTYTIIYPNGGSEESPGNVSVSTTYIENNPFPGYAVKCEVELYYEGQWGTMPYCGTYSGSSDLGLNAFAAQHNDGNITLVTGNYGFTFVDPSSAKYGTHANSWTSVQTNVRITDPVPCRIKVYKIGKIDSSVPDIQEVSVNNIITVDEDQYLSNSFAIVYPNNGTADSPANITLNTRYVLENPFPGYYVKCSVEILWNNEWGEVGWIYEGTSVGVKATQLNDNNIIIQTAKGQIITYSNNDGTPFNNNINDSTTHTAPFRIKVWKVGKIQT